MPDAARPAPELITVQEAARRAGVSADVIYRWLAAGRITGQRYPGRRRATVRVDAADLDRFMDATRTTGAPAPTRRSARAVSKRQVQRALANLAAAGITV